MVNTNQGNSLLVMEADVKPQESSIFFLNASLPLELRALSVPLELRALSLPLELRCERLACH